MKLCSKCNKSGPTEKGHIQCKICGTHVFECKNPDDHNIRYHDNEFYCDNCHVRFKEVNR